MSKCHECFKLKAFIRDIRLFAAFALNLLRE